MNKDLIDSSSQENRFPDFNSSHMLELQIGNKNDDEEFYTLNMRKQDTIMISASMVTEAKDLNGSKIDTTQDKIQMVEFQRTTLQTVQSKYENQQSTKKIISERDQRFSNIGKGIYGFQRRKCQDQIQKQEQSINVEISQFQNVEVVPIKLMKAINLLVNVKSFYRQLSKNQRIWGKLTDQQHYVIGDVTSFRKQDQQSNVLYLKIVQFVRKILEIIQQQKNSILILIPVFSPQSLWKRIWDLFQAFLIISTSFLLSLKNFFFLDISHYEVYFHITSFAFVVDVIFNFNTALIQKGNLNQDRNYISLKYLKGNFAFDCIGMIPILIQQFNNQSEFNALDWIFNLLIVCKFFLLSKIIENIAFYLNYEKNSKNSVDLAKLLFMIGCVCHFFCILWHGLGVYEVQIGIEQNWLSAQNLVEEQNVMKRYVYSFYFLAVTMITVGYGDITPKNQYEMCFTILTMFTTGFIYAYCLNKIGSILENIEKKDKQYKESMQIIHGFMREENVSTILRAKISNYLEYLYKESNEVQKQHEKSIIEILSNQLKSDLIKDVQGKYIRNLPILSKLNTLQEIIYIMEECLFSPGEFIFRQKDNDDSALYLLVKESQNRNIPNTVLKTIETQQYFGEISFFTGFSRTASAVAVDFCRVYKIKRERFLEVIKKNEQDFENYQMIVETLTQKNNFKFANIKCYQCGQGDHYSINCPKTHLTFSKQVLISLNNKSVPQLERLKTERRTTEKQCSLLLIPKCMNGIYEINNNQKYFDILDELEQGLKLDEFYDSQSEDDDDEDEESSFLEKIPNLNKKNKDDFNNSNSKMNALGDILQKEIENEKLQQQSTDISNQLLNLEQKDQNNKSRLSIFNSTNNIPPSQTIAKYRSSIVENIQNSQLKNELSVLQSVSECNKSSQSSSESDSSGSGSDSSSQMKIKRKSINKKQTIKSTKASNLLESTKKMQLFTENDCISSRKTQHKKEKKSQKDGSLVFQDEDLSKESKLASDNLTMKSLASSHNIQYKVHSNKNIQFEEALNRQQSKQGSGQNNYQIQASQDFQKSVSRSQTHHNRDQQRKKTHTESKQLINSSSSLKSYSATKSNINSQPNVGINKRQARQSINQQLFLNQFQQQAQGQLGNFQQNLLGMIQNNKRQSIRYPLMLNDQKYQSQMSKAFQINDKNQAKQRNSSVQKANFTQLFNQQFLKNVVSLEGNNQYQNQIISEIQDGCYEQSTNYYLLQNFEAAKIFNFYYPNQNFIEVIKNLKYKQQNLFGKKRIKKMSKFEAEFSIQKNDQVQQI